MSRTGIVLFLIFLSFSIAGCGGGSSSSNGGGGGSTRRNWTYMVYMGADNNLSESALEDLNEMEMAGSTSNVAIIVQAEFSNNYSTGVPADTRRIYVEKDNDETRANLDGTSIGNVDMADPATLAGFIRWAASEYPADNYALVIWDHGAGWKAKAVARGAVEDDTSGTFMSLPDLARGVRDSGIKISVMDFDACLMAMYEVAYEFTGLVDYMVFSEANEPADGDPYDTILSGLINSPGMNGRDLAILSVNEYADFYAVNGREKTTKSAIDMSRMAALDEKVRAFADALLADSTSSAVMQSAEVNTQEYDYEFNHDLYSVASYVNGLTSAGVKAAAAEVMAEITGGLVVANRMTGTGAEGSTGIAIYLPQTSETNDSDMSEYSLLAINAARSTGSTWGSYLSALLSSLGGGTLEYSGSGPFGFMVDWSACDADLDLYVMEPDGNIYAPYDGPTTPNGTFTPDSFDSGQTYETYIANDTSQAGTYTVLVNYYSNGPTCARATPNVYLYDPIDGYNEFTLIASDVMDLTNPYPLNVTCPDLLCLDSFSDWWWVGDLARDGSGRSGFSKGAGRVLNTKKFEVKILEKGSINKR